MQDNDLPQIGTPMQTDETRAREVSQADEMLCDAIAGALAKYSVAYSHVTLTDMRTVERSWKVHEVVEGNPFDRDEWLGVFDNKEEANAFCAKLRRDAALQITARHRAAFAAPPAVESKPIPMILHCPGCGEQHVDEPDTDFYDGPDADYREVWTNPPHRSHLCHACGRIWRPADVATEGVRSIRTAGEADTWGWDGASVKPTLHPSDREAIALVVEQAQFLCDRLGDLDWCDLERTANDFNGHVDPALSRLKSTLGILALSGSLAPANPTERDPA